MMNDLIQIRGPRPEDIPFIFSTWLKGLYYGNDFYGAMDHRVFFKSYHEIVEKILTRSGVAVQAVCLKEDNDVILAYAVTEGNILHWVYTKDVWRKQGLAKLLIEKAVNSCSHLTKIGQAIKPMEWEFNPFLAIKEKDHGRSEITPARSERRIALATAL